MTFLYNMWAALRVFLDIFVQKFFVLGVPALRHIGGDVRGLTCIVTGPTSGIGRETALELSRRGANVILACRSEQRGTAVREACEAAARFAGITEPSVRVMRLDLGSLASIRSFVAAFAATGAPLHVLINNAGVYDITGPRRETVDGFEQHLGTNHLGPFLLTLLLLPTMRRCAADSPLGGRIVHVSSLLHIQANLSPRDFMLARGYLAHTAYSNSKCAQVLFTRAMREMLGSSSNVHVFAVHPGIVLTDIARNIPRVFYRMYKLVFRLLLLTPQQGARSTLHCATSPDAPQQGKRSFGYFNSDCKPQIPGPAGADDVMMYVLWAYSARKVDLPAEFDLTKSQ